MQRKHLRFLDHPAIVVADAATTEEHAGVFCRMEFPTHATANPML